MTTYLYRQSLDDQGIDLDLAEALQNFHAHTTPIQGGYSVDEIWARLTQEQYFVFALKHPALSPLFKETA